MDKQPNNVRPLRTYRILTIASAILLLSFTLLLPLSWDNEIYQSMASDLLRFQRLPYLGSWDQNFPGIVALHAASILLFGNSTIGFRVFDLLIHIAMSWLLFQVTHRWLSARSAWIATVIYNIRYISSDSLPGERDPFAVFFVLLAVWAFFQIDRHPQASIQRRKFFALIAGISMAVTSTIRPTYLPFVLLGATWLLLLPSKFKKQMVFAYATGIMLVFFSILLPYFLSDGGLREFYLSTIRYNLDIYGSLHLSLHKVFVALLAQKFYIGFGLLGIAVACLRQKKIRWMKGVLQTPSRGDVILIAGIGLTGLVSLVVMGKYFIYHYEPLMLVLIPFASVGLESFVGVFRSRMYRYCIMSALIGFVIFRVAPFSPYSSFLAYVFDGNPYPIERAQDERIAEPNFRISVEKAVADYIDRTSALHECVACATLTSGIRWRTSRFCTSRFTTFYPITMSASDGSHPSFQMAWRKEYIDSLRSERPYYIVIANGPKEIVDWALHIAPSQSIHGLEGFDSLILPHYKMDTTIGGYSILKRLD